MNSNLQLEIRHLPEKTENFLILIISLLSSFNLFFSSNSQIDKIVLIAELIILLFLYSPNLVLLKVRDVVLFGLCFTSLLFSILLHSALGTVTLFLNMLLAFSYFTNLSLKKKNYIWMHLLNGGITAIYLFTLEKPHYIGGRVEDKFGNSINSNMISILFLCSFLHIICALYQLNIRKFFKTILYLLTVYIYSKEILFYGSRSAFICLLIYLFFSFIVKKEVNPDKFQLIMKTMISLCILVPIIYLSLYKTVGQFELFGKSFFSGRQYVWDEAFDLIRQHPILGVGNEISVVMRGNGELTTSMHNTILSIWKILGIVPTLSFIYISTRKNGIIKNSYVVSLSQYAFICTFPLSFFESFYTESILYMGFLLFLISSIKEND